MEQGPGNEPTGEAQSYCDPAPFAVEAQGQRLTFLPGGQERLEALIALIDGAQGSLRLCFYIFADDTSGQRVLDALCNAARRGVEVVLIVDGFGVQAEESFFEPLVEAGGRFSLFMARWSRRYLIRNHQKIVLVDGAKAMIGGFNIEDSYFDPPARNGWHDLGVVVEGEAVDMLGRWFAELEAWIQHPKAQFRAIRRMVREWQPGSGPVQLLIGGPTRFPSSWGRSVARDLACGKTIDLVMAYFSPPFGLLKRIAAIASSGHARLVLAGKSDNGATLGATRSLYTYLLKRKVQIREFSPCKLHMKLIVIDDAVYLGSANFDMRSLYINLELMLRIEDAGLAERMREFIAGHQSASQAVTLAYHKRQATVWNRIRWVASWFLVAVVDYTVSRRLNLGL